MLSNTHFCLVVLLLIQGALLSTAHPTASTSLSGRAKLTELLESQMLGPEGPDRKEYTLDPLPEADQGSWSDTYRIVEPFMGNPAILKVVREDDGKTDIEIRYLKSVKLYLHAEAEPMNRVYFIVCVDVERREAAPFRPLYKWYLEDENMDLRETLIRADAVIEHVLGSIADNKKLLYFDFDLKNFFFDKTITYGIPVDWGPPEGNIAGVEEVLERTKDRQRAVFDRYLDTHLPKRINVGELAKILAKRGKQLREEDKPLLQKFLAKSRPTLTCALLLSTPYRVAFISGYQTQSCSNTAKRNIPHPKNHYLSPLSPGIHSQYLASNHHQTERHSSYATPETKACNTPSLRKPPEFVTKPGKPCFIAFSKRQCFHAPIANATTVSASPQTIPVIAVRTAVGEIFSTARSDHFMRMMHLWWESQRGSNRPSPDIIIDRRLELASRMFSRSQAVLLLLLFFQGALFCSSRPTTPTSLSIRTHPDYFESLTLGPEGPHRKEYHLTPLPDAVQGSWSDTYHIKETFMGRSAVLKIVGFKGHEAKNKEEVENLKTMNLYLHHEYGPKKRLFIIISKDVERGETPYKPLHKWYIEGKLSLGLEDTLDLVRTTIEDMLVRIALEHNLLYFDFGLNNCFLTETLKGGMPVDWGPPERDDNGELIAGVERVLDETFDDQRDAFADYIREHIPKRINVEELAKALRKHGMQLREEDVPVLEKFLASKPTQTE